MRNEVHHSRLNSRPDASTAACTTEHDTETRLARIWEEVLGLESIGLDQNYFDLGGDSSLTVQLFFGIEKVFKIKLPLAVLFEAPTIADLARVLDQEMSESRRSSVIAIQPSGSRPPFFCIHASSGSALIYRNLAKHFGSDQPFYGLQSQGLDGTGLLLTKIEDMAASYVKDIRKVRPHGPYFLGGYRMGATIAFEIARQLHTAGEVTALLALFDGGHCSRVSPPSTWDRSYYVGQRLAFHTASFLRLALRSKLKDVARNFTALGRTVPIPGNEVEPWLDAESSESLLGEILEANDRACSNYIPKEYPGAITDFRPMKQYRMYNKAQLKWSRLAQSGQEIFVLPVYPDEMLAEPFVRHLAAALRQSMDRAIRECEAGEASSLAVQIA